MASESVTILIEAEDQATAVLESTTVAIEKTSSAAKSAGTEMAKMATVRDELSDVTDELDDMGESLSDVANRTDELAEKTGGWLGSLGKVAGVVGTVIATFTGAMAVGKMLGDWIFQTEKLERQLLADLAALEKVNDANLKRDQIVMARQIELANLESGPDKDAALDDVRGGMEDQLIAAGLLVETEKQHVEELENGWFVLKSTMNDAKEALRIAEARKAVLMDMTDQISEDVLEHEKAVEARKKEIQAVKDLAQSQFDMFNEYAKMADEKNKEDEKRAKDNQKAVEVFDEMARKQDEKNKQETQKQREKEAEEAEDVFNNLAKAYDDINKQEAADADKAEKEKIAQAKKALAAKAKLSKAEQSTPDLQATEGRLLTGGSGSDPQKKMVVSLQEIVDYMAAEQAKLDAMVKALENSNKVNVLP